MKTKSILFIAIAMFTSVLSFSQSAGAGSGSGSGNGSSGTTGAGRGGSRNHSLSHRTAHHRKHIGATSGTRNNSGASANTTTTTPTNINNTGSNSNTMPDNNDPGKETTNPNGKDGPTNGVVQKGRTTSSAGTKRTRKK